MSSRVNLPYSQDYEDMVLMSKDKFANGEPPLSRNVITSVLNGMRYNMLPQDPGSYEHHIFLMFKYLMYQTMNESNNDITSLSNIFTKDGGNTVILTENLNERHWALLSIYLQTQ